ncbi:MAG: hypothetical protein E7471_03165 [Ruminococcaceae bacterium]|nr:hypothetical protein [Oscillospiraceae bacterium]
MKNRILAITLVVCMLVCYIPTAIPAVAADFSMPEHPVFLADGELYEFGEGASDSITWSSIGDSLLLSDSGHAIGMGSGLSIVSAVDAYGIGHSTPVYVSDTIATYAFADVAAALLGDAESFDLTTINSFEASQVEGAESDEWMYVDGNASATYSENGLQFFAHADHAEYLQFQVNVSEDGNYVAMLPYAPSAVADVYLAPADAETASEIAYTDSQFNVFTTEAGDGSSATVLEAKKVLSLSAGEYYLTFTQVSGASLALDSFKLFRIGEKADVPTDISLSCENDVVLEGAEFTVTTDILPSDLEDAALVYYSDNSAVVSIEDGNAKANAYGKASINVVSANNPFVSDSIEITVAAVADDYQFASLAQTFAVEYEGLYDLKNTQETAAMLVNNYAGSALVKTSSPFSFVDMGTNCSYRAATPENGLYLFSAKNSATNTAEDRNVVMKIKVTESGQFLPAMIHLIDATVAGADVYLAPLNAKNKTADEYLILEVSNAGRPSDDSEIEKTTLASKAINLPKGEYYLSLVKTNDDGDGEYRYLRIKNFSFYKIGEYIAPDSIDLYAQHGVILNAGDTTTITASAVPAAPYIDITWSSSNENIAKVDAQGKVTALKKGVATITATTTDGSGVCGSIQILVDATPTYEYEIQDFAVDKGIGLLVNKATTAESTADYGGWAYYTFDGTPTIFAANVPAVPNVISVGKYYAIKVTIAESGTYAAEAVYDTWSSSSDGDVYITPAVINGKDVTSATAFTSDNKLVYIPWNTANGNNLTASSNKTVTLDAGEYVLWIKKEASYNNSTYTNPETGKLESGNRDRYFFIDAINLYKVMDGTIETVDGAQIRTTGKQGLRFISSIDKSLIDSEKIVSYGTLLIPTEDLDDPEDLVIGYEYSINGNKAAQVEAKKVYAEDDKTITFTAVLTDIKPEKYTRAISARAYAITESGSVIYSDVIISRSPYQIAKLIEANPAATASEKAVAADIIAAVDGE